MSAHTVESIHSSVLQRHTCIHTHTQTHTHRHTHTHTDTHTHTHTHTHTRIEKQRYHTGGAAHQSTQRRPRTAYIETSTTADLSFECLYLGLRVGQGHGALVHRRLGLQQLSILAADFTLQAILLRLQGHHLVHEQPFVFCPQLWSQQKQKLAGFNEETTERWWCGTS